MQEFSEVYDQCNNLSQHNIFSRNALVYVVVSLDYFILAYEGWQHKEHLLKSHIKISIFETTYLGHFMFLLSNLGPQTKK